MQEEAYLFISTNITPLAKKWEKQCFEVFSQGLEEMHHELSKDGENHKLGDVENIPTEATYSRFAHV